MERRKSALEEAQEAALNFALDDDDDVSVISFESASSGGEEGELDLSMYDQENTNTANSNPKTTKSTKDAHKHKQSSSSPSIKAPKRSPCPPPSSPLNEEEEMKYKWARARALALASVLQPGLESSDDDDLSLGSSESEGSASKTGPKPPKRKNTSSFGHDTNNNDDKADEIFSQMQLQSGKYTVSRRSLPPSLTRYESGESTATSKSAKSFPPTIKRSLSHQPSSSSFSSSYRDPRHRKDYGRGQNNSRTPRVTRATSLGTSTVSSTTSSASFKVNPVLVAATSKKDQEKRDVSQFRQSFIRSMEDRLSMRIQIKERRYDEENQQRSLQENHQEEEEEEQVCAADNEILTAETQIVPTSVNLTETQSLAESTIPGRKLVHSILIYSLLGIIAIATISILVVVLSQKDEEEGGLPPLVEQKEQDSPVSPPTIAPEVVPDQVLAVVPKTICMEQVPGDGWSTQCTPEQSIVQGGGVCNLVAQSFLDQVEGADIAFQSSTACLGDIVMGNFTVADAYQILPHNERLWNIQVTGFDILTVLEQVLEATFGINRGKRDYPYAAGLRFAVNASAPYLSRISDLEINRRLEEFSWEPLDMEEKYSVVASENLLMGGTLTRDTPYAAFAQAHKDQFPRGKTWRQTTTTFVEYAKQEKVLRDPPMDTYSTTFYVP